MKFRAWNIGQLRRNFINVLAMGRTFVILAMLSGLFFILLGTLGIAEKKMNTSPVSSMKGLAASVSSHFFIDMVGMELPHSKNDTESSALSNIELGKFVFQWLTDINPSDPKSLVAREVPGLGSDGPILLRTGIGNPSVEAPQDEYPGSGSMHTIPDDVDEGDVTEHQPIDGPSEQDDDAREQDDQAIPPGNKNIVMIYHSHPHESFNPVLGTNIDNPSSSNKKKSIGLVGDAMANELTSKGIATLHSYENYLTKVSNYNYNYSYKYTKETVKKAMSENGKLQYFIDIHRDSQKHPKTTIEIDGVTYAQVYFIIGHANPNWRQNEELASKIHDRLEKLYPGISRGIWGKTSSQGNGEYNQSLSPGALLIEIGGIDNTEEELTRTSKAFAQVLADIYWEEQEAEKAGSLSMVDSKESNQ